MNIDLLKQDLIRDEGLRTMAYRDTKGLWTIGIGHLLPQDRDWTGVVWSASQIDVAFQSDLRAALSIAQSVPDFQAMTDARQRALSNMGFQLGHRLLTFGTFLSLLHQRKYKEAGEDLRTTLWYKQVPVRAGRIIQMIQAG